MKLYSAWYCPFAQRAWIALLHKELSFEYVEIDPYLKTAEWMAISRGTGQVPVVVDNVGSDAEIGVPDSMRTLEYIDGQFQSHGPLLFPIDPAKQADAKFWIDFQGAHIIPYFYRYLKAVPLSEASEIARCQLEKGLETFASSMGAEGPFFSGDTAGAIDIAFAPFALRIEILLSRYKHYALPEEGAQWRRYHRWWQAMAKLPALNDTMKVVPDYREQLINFYLSYSEEGGQEDVTQTA